MEWWARNLFSTHWVPIWLSSVISAYRRVHPKHYRREIRGSENSSGSAKLGGDVDMGHSSSHLLCRRDDRGLSRGLHSQQVRQKRWPSNQQYFCFCSSHFTRYSVQSILNNCVIIYSLNTTYLFLKYRILKFVSRMKFGKDKQVDYNLLGLFIFFS